jgi:hypothetical protein
VLSSVFGDLTITQPGVYSNLDVHGFVNVRANNVTITNSIIRGGVASGDIGLINNLYGNTGLVVSWSTLVPEHPSVRIDGIKGANYTADHLDIHGTVDGAKVFGNDTRISNCWIHDLAHFAVDPDQNGGPSHNDDVQVLGGSNITIVHNTLLDAWNSAMQVTQTRAPVVNLDFTQNWAGNGACTVNLQDAPLTSMSDISVTNNLFYKTSTYNCAIAAYTGVAFVNAANTWPDGTPVKVVTK